MGLGGVMHRVTPDHYNLYDEREELVGEIHRLPGQGGFPTGHPLNEEAWWGKHTAQKEITGFHTSRHHVAADLLQRHARIRGDLGLEP